LPDVYQGSLIITTAFIALIPKIAYIFLFFKLFIEFYHIVETFTYLISLFSILYGSIITLYQTSFRRLIAYGSMVHIGFMICQFVMGV
jgi:NADH-quinone oxidoreductase subunit N